MGRLLDEPLVAGCRFHAARPPLCGFRCADHVAIKSFCERDRFVLRSEFKPEEIPVNSEQIWCYVVRVEPSSHQPHYISHVAALVANFNNVHRVAPAPPRARSMRQSSTAVGCGRHQGFKAVRGRELTWPSSGPGAKPQ